MAGPGDVHRSGQHAAHPPRQHDHRRRGRHRSRGGGRDRASISRSDLVVYRADAPQGLVERQAQAWDPVIDWARDRLGARFVLGGRDDLRDAARSGARCGASGDSERHLAARRGACDHHAHRLGADRARGARWPARRARLPGPPRMWTRTGTWSSGAATTLALERRAFRFAEMQAACLVLRTV